VPPPGTSGCDVLFYSVRFGLTAEYRSALPTAARGAGGAAP
jgi:hypothetical protein